MYFCVPLGPRKFEVWLENEIEALLLLVKENYSRLTGRAEKRMTVWQDIGSQLAVKVCITELRQVKALE